MSELRIIDTQALDLAIRCAMCTNSMASDRGCDGGCVVNEGMYKKVLGVIDDALERPQKHMTHGEKVCKLVRELSYDYDIHNIARTVDELVGVVNKLLEQQSEGGNHDK